MDEKSTCTPAPRVPRQRRRDPRIRTVKLSITEDHMLDSFRGLSRDEQWWICGLVFSEARRRSAGFVKAEAKAPPPKPDPNAVYPSKCCGAESTVHLLHAGVLWLRCSACSHKWTRPAPPRNGLHLVEVAEPETTP